jgi:hypothetical protein
MIGSTSGFPVGIPLGVYALLQQRELPRLWCPGVRRCRWHRVETLDGLPENVPDPVAGAVPITPTTVSGKLHLLDLGDEAYAVYGHLQPGSLKVKKGRRSEPLAAVSKSIRPVSRGGDSSSQGIVTFLDPLTRRPLIVSEK